MIPGNSPIQPKLRGALHLTLAVMVAVGVACGRQASPPPIATVAPPDLFATAPVVASTATVVPAAAVAPAQAPASTFESRLRALPSRHPLPFPERKAT